MLRPLSSHTRRHRCGCQSGAVFDLLLVGREPAANLRDQVVHATNGTPLPGTLQRPRRPCATSKPGPGAAEGATIRYSPRTGAGEIPRLTRRTSRRGATTNG